MIMVVEYIHKMYVRSFYYHIKLVNTTLPSSLKRKNILKSISYNKDLRSWFHDRENYNIDNKVDARLWFSREHSLK